MKEFISGGRAMADEKGCNSSFHCLSDNIMEIYSIGHSNRHEEDFINLLKRYGIEIVIDVRRFPTSKYVVYKKENLAELLKKNGIEYIHLENLGGYRGGYEMWMCSKEWKRDYERLKEIARSRKTAIMCAEKLPFRCHRRYIAKKLAAEGWKVIHIINERVWEEKGSVKL
jgi:uncharacterized protein (DUF488 family)